MFNMPVVNTLIQLVLYLVIIAVLVYNVQKAIKDFFTLGWKAAIDNVIVIVITVGVIYWIGWGGGAEIINDIVNTILGWVFSLIAKAVNYAKGF